MSDVYSFNVSLQPMEALIMVKESMPAGSELLHEEYNEVGNGYSIGTLVYERYFFRSGNQAALIVISDNLHGVTNIRLIAAGASKGIIMKMDWGAGKSFASSVEKVLSAYILE
ncbi:DUF6054 family protein [Paenibacillus sp. P46E]|uniref:DUF6054 family protein n=1 Tax=Paenibacillus sp. P46E TaxID=1349436 RepID=UPI000959ACD4|nr:DUF6054 family protein [Paenibacillus sp. P46E]OKP94412.1 hypothetical protein A3849_29200 [Paenibacillus sp. P46E]